MTTHQYQNNQETDLNFDKYYNLYSKSLIMNKYVNQDKSDH